jgi:hypothetical protein
MVFMPAAPFYAPAKPLRFRGIPDSLADYHLEGSECCLIHADNPLTPEKGVWLNPDVRVAYNGPAYEQVHAETGTSRISLSDIFLGLWKNRLHRWVTTTFFKEWRVSSRVRAWKRGGREQKEDRREPGNHCLINEIQVFVSNGWAHV